MKSISTIIVMILAIVCSVSCKSVKERKKNSASLEPNEIDQQIARAGNTFTFQLFKQVNSSEKGGKKNILLSPLSASFALSMTANGGRGTTLESVLSSLHLDAFSQEDINTFYLKTINRLPSLDRETSLEIANSIWFRKGFSIEDKFQKTNNKYYNSSVREVEFSDPGTPSLINEWVARKTNNKILNIVDSSIPKGTMMYLLNAIYFKGQWAHPFDKDRTHTAPFYFTPGHSTEIDFMHQSEAQVKIHADRSGDFVELPYGNGSYSMLIALPAEGVGITRFVQHLNIDQWNSMLHQLKERKVNLFLPKFKLEFEKELKEDLAALGMAEALGSQADFSGISANADLRIDAIKQKTFVEVNEEGTEAAAVTNVGVSVTSMPMIPIININRPFLFAIKENQLGTILFLGLMNNPTT